MIGFFIGFLFGVVTCINVICAVIVWDERRRGL